MFRWRAYRMTISGWLLSAILEFLDLPAKTSATIGMAVFGMAAVAFVAWAARGK